MSNAQIIESINRRLDENTIPEPFSGCWLWIGATKQGGYGRMGIGSRGYILAHVASYKRHRGEIPDGLELDHLCRTPCCVNPSHLEPVTHQENCRRGNVGKYRIERMSMLTHCKRGHPLFGDNLRLQSKTGFRVCKTCARKREKEWRSKQNV